MGIAEDGDSEGGDDREDLELHFCCGSLFDSKEKKLLRMRIDCKMREWED